MVKTGMVMSIFDYFDTAEYTFLRVSPQVKGLKILEEYEADGVFKIRGGMTVANIETPTADATLAVKAEEGFVSDLEADMVGHCVRVSRTPYETLDYRIVGQVEGYDWDTNELDFYKLSLKRETLWDQSTSVLT